MSDDTPALSATTGIDTGTEPAIDPAASTLSDEQYRVLLVFRCALREYLRWSAKEAAVYGLTPQQHQLLLVVRAHPGPRPPSISEIADYLLIRHHSAVELVTRAEGAGLLRRRADESDQRVVRVELTELGKERIEELSRSHLAELERVAADLAISEGVLEQLASRFMTQLREDPSGF
ncbi:MAG TPA: MarR family transcriptional regulator [Actinomycetales bacterium]|nr:MarR family transcriptional regulator [Actinomycetales bacterium]